MDLNFSSCPYEMVPEGSPKPEVYLIRLQDSIVQALEQGEQASICWCPTEKGEGSKIILGEDTYGFSIETMEAPPEILNFDGNQFSSFGVLNGRISINVSMNKKEKSLIKKRTEQAQRDSHSQTTILADEMVGDIGKKKRILTGSQRSGGVEKRFCMPLRQRCILLLSQQDLLFSQLTRELGVRDMDLQALCGEVFEMHSNYATLTPASAEEALSMSRNLPPNIRRRLRDKTDSAWKKKASNPPVSERFGTTSSILAGDAVKKPLIISDVISSGPLMHRSSAVSRSEIIAKNFVEEIIPNIPDTKTVADPNSLKEAGSPLMTQTKRLSPDRSSDASKQPSNSPGCVRDPEKSLEQRNAAKDHRTSIIKDKETKEQKPKEVFDTSGSIQLERVSPELLKLYSAKKTKYNTLLTKYKEYYARYGELDVQLCNIEREFSGHALSVERVRTSEDMKVFFKRVNEDYEKKLTRANKLREEYEKLHTINQEIRQEILGVYREVEELINAAKR